MYSRVTLLEVDTLRTSMEDAETLFCDRVLPGLQEQEGFEGVLVLSTAEGRGMIVTLWATEEEDPGGFSTDALERFATLFRSPPGREYYRVAVAELPHSLAR
jgi:heme-degrading monooxygenase HmoA